MSKSVEARAHIASWVTPVLVALLALVLVACRAPATQNAATIGATNQTASPPAPPSPREVELPSGAIVAVRLDRALSTVRNRTGDRFAAILDDPVVIDGMVTAWRRRTTNRHRE
jgi:hypothetical protein